MAAFNPYYVDEIVSSAPRNRYFGLIESAAEPARDELHGYEVTLSGRLVLPELCPRREPRREENEQAVVCETR